MWILTKHSKRIKNFNNGLQILLFHCRGDTIYVEPTQLEVNRHSTYNKSFFLLRIPFSIDGNLAQIGCTDGMLTLNSSSHDPSFGITFDSLYGDVNSVIKKYGIKITNSWCDYAVPLFEIKHSNPDGMEEFIHSVEMVQNELASKISAHLTERQTALVSGPTHQCPPVAVHTEVYLLTPDPVNKDADLVLVTPDNLLPCLALWKDSEANFGALFRKLYRK